MSIGEIILLVMYIFMALNLMFSKRLPCLVRFLTEFTNKRRQTDMFSFNVLLDILERDG